MARRVERQVGRILKQLRHAIRKRGFTQMEVQQALGWRGSYISQLLTKHKTLRLEQVLLILKAIDVNPADFFGEVFGFRQPYGPWPASPGDPVRAEAGDALRAQLASLRRHLDAVIAQLKTKRLITDAALARAVAEVERQP